MHGELLADVLRPSSFVVLRPSQSKSTKALALAPQAPYYLILALACQSAARVVLPATSVRPPFK
jgi:hypothetical protein